MTTIWKYPILTQHQNFEVMMPQAAEILAVGVQNDQAVIWALVVPERALEVRRFWIAITGGPVPPDATRIYRPAKYLGTFQVRDGGGYFVGHVFERVK